ncbi:MAG: hypothetical protein BWY11_01588 [Firmicutes bacterium ADurb.Bin182]|nr:MAG: hypothetical protein BWY11_01588 [Firmicutes bacterium ADurb.Bin182]
MNKKLGIKTLTGDMAVLILIALATTVFHLIISENYGYFLDEMYTLACSKHLSLAFVDIPPVAPALLALVTSIFGNSLFAIHLLPSVFSGAAVIIAGLMAKELGGGKWAVVIAGLAAAFVPVWMAVGTLYTYDFLDQFMIMLLFYFLIKLIKSGNLKLWLVIGAVGGIGLMTKPSMVFFIFALALALLFTKHRCMYATPWPWLGAGIAFVIILPAVIWQIGNGFPIVEYWSAYSAWKTVRASPLEFILMQVVGMNVILLPLWLFGLYYLLFDKEGKKYRLLGVNFLILFAIFLATGAKLYMLIPAYAMLLAGGAILFERFALKKKFKKILVAAYACLVAVTGAVQAPNFMPILPIDDLVEYYDTIGGMFGVKAVRLDNSIARVEIPQYFYDRLEWDVLVNDVAEVYFSIPEQERADTVIATLNYGWAGAVDLLGGEKGLPNAMCGQLNYYFFSLDKISSKTWVVIGESPLWMQEVFDSVAVAKTSTTVYRKPGRIPIMICRGPKFTVEEAIQGIKRFQ